MPTRWRHDGRGCGHQRGRRRTTIKPARMGPPLFGRMGIEVSRTAFTLATKNLLSVPRQGGRRSVGLTACSLFCAKASHYVVTRDVHRNRECGRPGRPVDSGHCPRRGRWAGEYTAGAYSPDAAGVCSHDPGATEIDGDRNGHSVAQSTGGATAQLAAGIAA
jgi:hypothetical protein